MRKISAYFLLFGMMCVMMSSCQQNESKSSSLDSSPVSDSKVIMYFDNVSTGVSVTCDKEINIYDISMNGYWLIFKYEVGTLQGQAHVRLSYGRLREYAGGEINDFLDNISLVFHYEIGKTSLTVNWSGNDYESVDTYILDEIANLWYYLWPNSDISFVTLTEQEAIKKFPNQNIITDKYYDTFICDEPVYNVSFYRVSDFDNIYGPDVLIGYYDEYSNDNLFLWQTDEMYKWHISIEYTDANGNIHFLSYITKNYGSSDPTNLINLDGPDWNTDE